MASSTGDKVDSKLLNEEQIVTTMEYRNKGRRMLSRKDVNKFEIISSITPGKPIDGCLICCSAPACCPAFTICPCCGDAEYIKHRRQASTYIYIRENSLEWNDPILRYHEGTCCGIDPCTYEIQDNIRVLYFDDLMFDHITDRTRCCNELRNCCFGGRGERLRIDSPVCCSCCQRSTFPCPCVPICCPLNLCPCLLRYEIYMEDAQKALYEIKIAKNAALQNKFYSKVNEDLIR